MDWSFNLMGGGTDLGANEKNMNLIMTTIDLAI